MLIFQALSSRTKIFTVIASLGQASRSLKEAIPALVIASLRFSTRRSANAPFAMTLCN